MFAFKVITSSMRCFPMASAQAQLSLASISIGQNNFPQQEKLPKRRFSLSGLTYNDYNPAGDEEPVRLPEKPKRPASSFLAYSAERRPQLLSEDPSLTVTQLSSRIAKEWPTVDKSKYNEEYQLKLKEYYRKMEDWEDSLNFKQIQHLEKMKSDKLVTLARKKIKQLEPPKKPRNPANFYVQEKLLNADRGDKKTFEVMKQLADEYRNLSDQEKQKYVDMRDQDVQRYKRDFNDWYEIASQEKLTFKKSREELAKMKASFDRSYGDK